MTNTAQKFYISEKAYYELVKEHDKEWAGANCAIVKPIKEEK